MSTWLVLTVAFGVFGLLAGCWLGWQLLRQNGRILLRLDELENRLNELEFGDLDEPEGLPVGSEPPAFELPDLAGGRQTLAQFHGQPMLLVFFNPECGFCRELAEVAAGFQPASEGGILPPGSSSPTSEERNHFHDHAALDGASSGLEARLTGRQGCPPPQMLIITTGEAEKNRQFFAEHKLSCPVLLQSDGEVAKAYQINGTPAGYLVSAEGKISSELAIGAEALLKLASQPAQELPLSPALSPSNGERETTGNGGDGLANRFGQRSVARSKIKRDGLKAGTPAPDFRLPRLDGRGDLALRELRGKRVLLVFSSPDCGPCNALAPDLEKFHRKHNRASCPELSPNSSHKPLAPFLSLNYSPAERPLTPSLSPGGGEGVHRTGEGEFPSLVVVMISKGEPKENRAKVKEHGLTFPVVLQQQWEISRRYAMFATPVAYLIDERGVIADDVAVGVEPILAFLLNANSQTQEQELAIR